MTTIETLTALTELLQDGKKVNSYELKRLEYVAEFVDSKSFWTDSITKAKFIFDYVNEIITDNNTITELKNKARF